MKYVIFFISLLWVGMVSASTSQLLTRFGALEIKAIKGPKFSIVHKNKTLLSLDALDVRQEATFRFRNKDIILLRFTQGTNSRDDILTFVSMNQNQVAHVSDTIRFPAGVLADVNQKDEKVVLDVGVERNTRTLAIYDGSNLEILKKGVSNTERFAEPLPDQDCSKIYNSLYLHAFGNEQCQTVSSAIKLSFKDSISYAAMLKRSQALSMDKLIGEAIKTCQQKSVLPYNDFKAKICGYSTSEMPVPVKSVATFK